jgi:hypothetical protein
VGGFSASPGSFASARGSWQRLFVRRAGRNHASRPGICTPPERSVCRRFCCAGGNVCLSVAAVGGSHADGQLSFLQFLLVCVVSVVDTWVSAKPAAAATATVDAYLSEVGGEPRYCTRQAREPGARVRQMAPLSESVKWHQSVAGLGGLHVPVFSFQLWDWWRCHAPHHVMGLFGHRVGGARPSVLP